MPLVTEVSVYTGNNSTFTVAGPEYARASVKGTPLPKPKTPRNKMADVNLLFIKMRGFEGYLSNLSEDLSVSLSFRSGGNRKICAV
jgi:hypothetical protein